MKNSILFSVSVFLFFISGSKIYSCTNFLVTKGASVNGSTMITYSADSHVLYGELYFWPAKDHEPGSFLEVYEWDTGKLLGKIKQLPHTVRISQDTPMNGSESLSTKRAINF